MGKLIFLLMLPTLLVIVPYGMVKIGRDAETWQVEVKKILETKDIPQSMHFFYSKGTVAFEAIALLVLTGTFLLMNTAWLWAPSKQPNDHLASIVLGIIFFPATIFFGRKACDIVRIWWSIDTPAVTLSKTGYQHGNFKFPWAFVENVTATGGYRRAPSVAITFKNVNGKSDRDVINLSLLRDRHLEEYINVYMSLSQES
ncbi:hypothetical protein [Paraburkholderia sp. BL21I4N1]|uniref:hypothetical protein n=1 Tax=Paraburkholderia sp. BL21I4N1 TaxID=1938801 RepID=UPI000D4FABA4|nr:hypothetical protein [Paraburkholderia sp. BL21I4N1]PQV49746.1 hypothetical protein B0G83_10634 [Paraburkholderia sp. BL21I4N1]